MGVVHLVKPIAIRPVVEEAPVEVDNADVRDAIMKALGDLELRQCVEMSRSRRRMREYIKFFREHIDPKKTFITRKKSSSWTKVWRTA